jgi:hypothetical protein
MLQSPGCLDRASQGVDIVTLPLLSSGKSYAKLLALDHLLFIESGYLLGPWALHGCNLMWTTGVRVVVVSPGKLRTC